MLHVGPMVPHPGATPTDARTPYDAAMATTITFLGAAGTVTGSKFLVEHGTSKVLMDCGLFQGVKELRERNWRRFPIDPAEIDAVVISHAHLDHVGYLPCLVRDGFAGKVISSGSTADMARVVMADSGRIQEEDADRANRRGYTKHAPALPLYTEEDADRAADRFTPIGWDTRTPIAPGVSVTLRQAGHILGSASFRLEFDDGTPAIMSSGDLGRPFHPILAPPGPPLEAGTVLIESTYGDTEHLEEDASAELGAVVRETAARGGTVIIPAFAIDRTEVVLHALATLAAAGTIPRLPVYVDSPMARSALGFYLDAINARHPDIRSDVMGRPDLLDPGDLRIVESVDESKAINFVDPPMVIISASGMATGGRVLHHLKRCLPDPRSSVVLVGYQAAGTRGSNLLGGAKTLRIHGEDVPVRATVHSVPAFSVHADRSELIDWLRAMPAPPQRIVAVHGDPEAAASLAAGIEGLAPQVIIPTDGQTLAV